jgi:hypothetical protein
MVQTLQFYMQSMSGSIASSTWELWYSTDSLKGVVGLKQEVWLLHLPPHCKLQHFQWIGNKFVWNRKISAPTINLDDITNDDNGGAGGVGVLMEPAMGSLNCGVTTDVTNENNYLMESSV